MIEYYYKRMCKNENKMKSKCVCVCVHTCGKTEKKIVFLIKMRLLNFTINWKRFDDEQTTDTQNKYILKKTTDKIYGQ